MKRHVHSLVVFFLLLIVVSLCPAAVFTVNKSGTGDFTKIQDAINAAGSGDTILVANGGGAPYVEDIVLKSGVNVFGEGANSTWIHGAAANYIVTAVDVEDAQIDGFAIYRSTERKTGVYISGGSVTVSNNWILQNTDGILIVGGSSSVIRNNLIEFNGEEGDALNYGIISLHSTPLITNNLIRGNTGCGVYIGWEDSAGTKVINNTIVNNDSQGLWCYRSSNVIIKNNIMSNNSTGISASHTAIPLLSYNDSWGNNWLNYDSQSEGIAAPGPGDISEDPLFEPGSLSYGLGEKSHFLSEESPCIDTGDPDPIYNDVDGTRNDMGYTGGPEGNPANRYGIMSGFIFTTIGKIPVSEITTTGDRIGLANVSSAIASNLHIYPYQDAPFGGDLWLHGLFGAEDTNVTYYQILVAKWTGSRPPSISAAVPLTDSLTKTYYTILADGTVKAQQYNCGPYNYWGLEGIYYRTNAGYWAHPDLVMIWRSASWANGKYRLFYKAYTSGGTEVTLPANTQDDFTLIVNNSNVQAEILAVKKDTGEVVPECGIIDVDSAMENIQFVVNAYHPEGYLREYTLHALYGSNKDGGDVIHEQYAGSHDATPPYWYGVLATNYDSATAYGAGLLEAWKTCAYEFRLNVYARTTDGYSHTRWKQWNEHLYINVGDCAWCGGADINHDGIVDLMDLGKLSQRWLDSSCGPCPLP
jgi:parallel beta-helix repeat protein